MTKLEHMAASLRACATISSGCSMCGFSSTETGKRSQPSNPCALIQSAMSVTARRKGFPLSMMCLGLVVTPSIPKVLYA